MTTLRAAMVYQSAATSVVAVESIEFHHHRSPSGMQLFGKLQPVAIVVKNQTGINAFDLFNEPLGLDDLMHKVPNLAVILDGD